jgi:hypothetical protein
MNLADMRAVVRCDLHDEDAGNYRWTDDELSRHIARAVKDLSEWLPCEDRAIKATTSGSRELDISNLSDRITVVAVEYPVDKFPKRYQRFSLWEDVLTILSEEVPDGSNACVCYGKLHTLEASGSTIPELYEDLVAAGAVGYAAVEWAIFSVNRVNVGGNITPRQFHDWGRERLNYFRRELRRLGRRNRVRLNVLYRPCYPVVSKSTDYGP